MEALTTLSRRNSWLAIGALSVTTVVGVSLPAEAVNFNFSYGKGTSLEQMVGFEMAGNMWSSYLTDNVTLNLHVGVSSDLPGNAVGGALPGMKADQSYEGFYNAVQQDRSSAADYTAANNLQAKRYSDGYLRYEGMFENGSKWYNRKVSVTRANAKALGMLGNSSALDGTILMGDLSGSGYQWNYDYNRDRTTSSQSLDFLSVALHEIGHTLGFISGVDSAKKAESQATYDENIDRLMKTTSLDMFRYSNYSEAQGKLELAAGARSYFSIDGGNTALAKFARGKKDFGLGSDGFQGSHWQDQSNALGIMGPTIRGGERRNLLNVDLQALDVIGWNVNYNAALNFNSLESQAKQKVSQKIADRWGWGTGYSSWIDSYINSGQNLSAADWISRERTSDVEAMIQDSQVYDLGYSRLWQEAFWQNAYNSTLSEHPESVSVPEPSSIGFLGLTVFVLTQLRQKRNSTAK